MTTNTPTPAAPGVPASTTPGASPGTDPMPGGADQGAGPNAEFSAPTLSLPKGGGAIRGIGEKFAANPVTGTGSFTVPIATSPGRSGFGPTLSLDYDSGNGNGPFGLGWNLALPGITRRTNLMLPLYQDADESDVFILSGAEDLVPVLDAERDWTRLVLDEPTYAPGYRIDRYRPRIEGLFARIERWTHKPDGGVHWRSITRDNITTLYGADANSQIADPADPGRVFSWLICQSYDDRGNAIVYEYKPEDSDNVEPGGVWEANRTPTGRGANRHIKRIRYGNRTPRTSGEDLHARTDWMFEVVFDYGEHDPATPTPAEVSTWLCRHDPFSHYRAGFEVRTYRLCQRVLMFHHFPNEAEVGADCLVQSTDLAYASIRGNAEDTQLGNPLVSQLAAVTHRGYRRQPAGGYLSRAMPPVEFDYQSLAFYDQVADIDPASLANLPAGLATTGTRWADLDGEGISGALTEQAGAWSYKANLGAGHFAPAQTLPQIPSLRGLAGGDQQLLDLTGTGTLDAVNYSGPCPGFFARTPDRGWEPFTPFTSLPNLRWNDPNLRFLDLDGDGLPDVLITEADALTWYPSLADTGFGPAHRTGVGADEEHGPRMVFADPDQSLAVADMSGDGLADLVRIRNGEVCYWPNLGHGRFGAKITMGGSPWFDTLDGFDHRYLQLADVDGSGTTDLIYLGRGGTRVWLNQAGNSFAEPVHLTAVPPVDHLTSIAVTDLLGTGTPCLVWSSPLPADTGRAMRYVDLMGGVKPYLLVGMRNNLGAETRCDYTSSTRFYLDDKTAGRRWLTKLPFPVYVVQRVTVIDRISRNRFVTRYRYHDGYFDPVEREFRGFGMVEQWDTDDIGALGGGDPANDGAVIPGGSLNEDPAHNLPPVWTKTWFHTGAYTPAGPLSRQFDGAYYRETDPNTGSSGLTEAQGEAMLLPDSAYPVTVLHPDGSKTPFDLSVPEEREAARALKGSILRHEIYALDTGEAQARPYQVSESNYTLELLQPLAANRHAVCLTHPRETVTFNYERTLYEVAQADKTVARLADPLVTHHVTLDVDGYGNVLRTAAIAYPRRHPDPATDLDPATRDALTTEQRRLQATLAENTYTNPVDDGTAYRTPLPAQTRSFELIHVQPASTVQMITNLFGFDELRTQVDAASDNAHDLPYEDLDHTGATTPAPYRRLLSHTRTLYRRDDLTTALPLGNVQSRALPLARYTLALTPGLISQAYQRRRNGQIENLLPDPAAVLGPEGGYLNSTDAKNRGLFPPGDPDGHWWTPSGQLFYSLPTDDSPAQELAYASGHFFLPHRFTDPFANTTTVTYDPYDLLPAEASDALDNRITVGTRAADGTVAGDGHDYRVLQPRLITDPNRNRVAVAYDALGMVAGTVVMGKPENTEGDSLTGFVPDLDDTVLAAHVADPLTNPQAILGNATTRLVYDLGAYQRTATIDTPQPSIAYSLARETHTADLRPGEQTKIQHTFVYSDGFGRDIQHKTQATPGPLDDGSPANPRWVGSGWTIFNNKGKPVRQYEPFFTATHHFEFARMVGVSPVLFYDPLERVVATLQPNNTYAKILFDPWRQSSFDVNDTVLGDPRTDPDIEALTSAYLATQPDFQTWYTQRATGGLGVAEQDAATKTTVHANTPTLAYHDTLGQPFLTVARNRFTRTDSTGNTTTVEERYPTRIVLDVEGNHRAVLDALGRTAAITQFGPGAHQLKTSTADAGDTITLTDVTGKPIRSFDNRGHTTRPTYDPLRRSVRTYVRLDTGPEALRERIVYGEALGTPEAANLRTRPYLHFDGAGVLITEKHDFTGNPLQIDRRLATVYREQVNWSPIDSATDAQLVTTLPEDQLEPEIFATNSTYDALNRVTTSTTHDASTTRTTYDEAGHVLAVAMQLRGTTDNGNPVWTPFVTSTNYDAKGQRLSVATGNGVTTSYTYDQQTFRLTTMITRRVAAFPDDCPNPLRTPCGVQNLRYTYDPTGNITHLADAAQQRIFFNNTVVDPTADYTYDSTYRLITATGREHIGQQAPPNPTWNDVGTTGLAHPQDGTKMRRYTQRYDYDPVGNLRTVAHQAKNGSWTRTYRYAEPSLLVGGEANNRLTSTEVGGTFEPYVYDEHGNTISMPHLPTMTWDDGERFEHADLGGGGRVYYTYDASGQRTRKVLNRKNGTLQSECIYLSGFEIAREYAGSGTELVVERQSLHVADGPNRVALVETRTVGHDAGPAALTRYQYLNHLGSSALELDDQAEVISYEEYLPYGSTCYQAVRSQVGPKRYRYTGKERDSETGLNYHGARFYAPWLGRWTSVDPVDTGSSFSYVRNNPVCFADPTGAFAVDWKEFGKGVLYTIGTAVLIAAAVSLVAATGGVAAGAIAYGLLGVSLTTAATVAEVTSGVILAGAALYGGIQTGKRIMNVTTGRDYDTGRPLSNAERSYEAGGLFVDVAALALSATKIPGARAKARVPAEMLDTLRETRAGHPDTGARRGGRGNMTLSQTEKAGVRTPVVESVKGQPNTNEGHAEILSRAAAEGIGEAGDRTTTVVDSAPCELCDPQLEATLSPGSRVVVPRAVGEPPPPRSVAPNPNRVSVKGTAERAARGLIKVEPYTIIKSPKSFGQHFIDAPKGPLLLLTPGGRPPGPDPGKPDEHYPYQLQFRF